MITFIIGFFQKNAILVLSKCNIFDIFDANLAINFKKYGKNANFAMLKEFLIDPTALIQEPFGRRKENGNDNQPEPDRTIGRRRHDALCFAVIKRFRG